MPVEKIDFNVRFLVHSYSLFSSFVRIKGASEVQGAHKYIFCQKISVRFILFALLGNAPFSLTLNKKG